MNPQGYEQLTLFPADSLDPASRSVLPGSAEARMMTVTSGLRCLELSRNSGPLGSLVKMLLGSSTWHSTRCYLTWKPSATPAGRLLFRLVPSTPRTGGTDARLWPTRIGRWKANIQGPDGQPILWETPIASDGANRQFYRNSRGEPNLSGMVKLWPTPTARDFKGANSARHLMREGKRNHTGQLANAVKLWPTPTSRNGTGASAGIYPSLVNIQPTAVLAENLKSHCIPPVKLL